MNIEIVKQILASDIEGYIVLVQFPVASRSTI